MTTRTSTLPATRFRVDTVRDVSEFTFRLAAAVEPNCTFDTSTKPEPVIVTVVAPLVDPLVADSLLTFGAATYRKRVALVAALVPAELMAFTSTVPDPFGATAVTWVSEPTVTLVPARLPNITFVTPIKPEPVRVTFTPPAGLPFAGDRAVIDGGAAAVAEPAGIATSPAKDSTSAKTTPTKRRPEPDMPHPSPFSSKNRPPPPSQCPPQETPTNPWGGN